MGDAMTDAARMAREDKAEQAYHEALIKYLYESSPENKVIAEEKMKQYAAIVRDAYKVTLLRHLQSEFAKFDANDRGVWKEFNREAEGYFFKVRRDLKELFFNAARKRGVGSMQWVI